MKVSIVHVYRSFFFSGAGYVWPRTFLARLLFVAGLLEVGFVPCNHRNGCDGLISLIVRGLVLVSTIVTVRYLV